MMELIFTKEAELLKKWDDFVAIEDKASHLMLSEWVKSFASYGFDYEFCLCIESGKVVGGYAAVIAKALFFRFYIVPFGPILSSDSKEQFEALVASVPERAKKHGACYCHITFPVSPVANSHVYGHRPVDIALRGAKSGHRFKYVYSSNGLNWIGLQHFSDEESLLESFRPSVRRYIRSSLRKGLELKYLREDDEIKMGYALCLENAANNNYSLRDWNSFGPTLLKMIADGSAIFLGAFKDGILKGSALVITAGNYNTYILGGTVKEKPDLLAGHFLHWNAIRISFQRKLSGYNISLGGSKGVTEFKNSYANRQILFEDSKYHWVLRPLYFNSFLLVDKYLKTYKKPISKFLSALKK